MFGRGYVIDHVLSTLKKFNREETYKNYIAEALKSMVYNTAKQGSVMTIKSYSDIITSDKDKKNMKIDNEQKANNIINHIKKKLRGG